MEKCYFCKESLNFLNSVKLADDAKLCKECHGKICKNLNLGVFNSKKITISEIESKYSSLGRNFSDEINDLLSRREDVSYFGIFASIPIVLKSGMEALFTTEQTVINQLNDNRIFFNERDPEFFYLIDRSFQGAKYKQVFSSESTGNQVANTTSKTKDRKKGKAGKVVTGAIIGTMLAPGLGTAIGAFAGSKGKDKTKSKKKEQSVINSKEIINETTQEIEVKSLASLTFLRLRDNKTVTVSLLADTTDYSQLQTLQIHELENSNAENNNTNIHSIDLIAKLKELKELLDLEILTQEEFDSKKKELLNL